MNAVLYPLAAIVAWSAAVYKLPGAIRRPRDPHVITLTAALSVLGLIFAISTPPIWTWIDRVAGWPNLSFLLSQGCVMIWTVTVQILMVLWAYPPAKARSKIRTRLLIAAATITTMITLFSLAPVLPEDSTDFAARFAGRPYIAAYLCVYIVTFAWMQGEIAYLCLRTVQVGGRVWLRRGLRATAIGAMLGLVYCLVRASDVVAATTGIANPERWEDVARLAVSVGVVLPPIGWTMPSWGPRLTEAREWATNVNTYRRLYPLWSVLHDTFAAKDLDPPQGLAARVAFRDLKDWRVPRRLALIWDCMLELQPYHDPELEKAAARLRTADSKHQGIDHRAAVEAEVLLAALSTYRQSQLQAGTAPAPATVQPREDAAREQLSSELDWLIAVARAIKRHPAQVTESMRKTEPSRYR